MLADFTERLARFVTTRWRLVLAFGLTATVLLFATAPKWKDIAYDGDFEYLPKRMNSVAAARVLDEAFPGDRARSQIVLVLGRESTALNKTLGRKATELSKDDLMVGDDLLRRLHHRLAEVYWLGSAVHSPLTHYCYGAEN